MLSYLIDSNSEGLLGFLNSALLRSISAGITTLLLGFIIAPRLFLKLSTLRLVQSFREKEEWGSRLDLHAGKKNTSTMGGLMIFITVVLSTLLWVRFNPYVLVALVIYATFTLIGFWDDYLKISRKDSRGLRGKYKLIAQAVPTLVVLSILFSHESSAAKIRELWIPIYPRALIDSMPLWFLFGLSFFVLAGSSNAVNLTDGIDGLAAGCVVIVSLVYAIIATVVGDPECAAALSISYLPGAEELAVLCSAIGGATLVFLWYNAHPAQIFMGDTGSLALGGVIGGVALMTHHPFTLVIVGGIFVMEAVSVMIQVGSFKLRKKRVFRMSPIHHHFELKGWPEPKIVTRFWILSLLCSLVGLLLLLFHKLV